MKWKDSKFQRGTDIPALRFDGKKQEWRHAQMHWKKVRLLLQKGSAFSIGLKGSFCLVLSALLSKANTLLVNSHV